MHPEIETKLFAWSFGIWNSESQSSNLLLCGCSSLLLLRLQIEHLDCTTETSVGYIGRLLSGTTNWLIHGAEVFLIS